MPRDTSLNTPFALPLASSAAPLSLEQTLSRAGRRQLRVDEAADDVVAELVRKRLAMERSQGWVVLGLFVSALAAVIAVGTRVGSPVFLGVTAALTASLALGLGFSVERVFWLLFLAEGRLQGLSEGACRQIFDRASRAEKMVDVLRSCGKEATDKDLASFVR